MVEREEAEPLAKAHFESLCRELTQQFSAVLISRPELARSDVLATVLMRMHEVLAAHMPQEVRNCLAFEIAAYAGDLMTAPKPLTPYISH